jgi:hypothetical protein
MPALRQTRAGGGDRPQHHKPTSAQKRASAEAAPFRCVMELANLGVELPADVPFSANSKAAFVPAAGASFFPSCASTHASMLCWSKHHANCATARVSTPRQVDEYHEGRANAPVQPVEPANPAVKPSCTRIGFNFKTSRIESKNVTEKIVGGAACVHAYNAEGATFSGISISTHPSNGTLTQIDATHFRYQVRAGFKGSDEYAIRACATSKGGSGCSILTYHVTAE